MNKTGRSIIRYRFAGALIALALSGCGIDQGGVTSPSPVTRTGGSSPLLVVGPVTGFGSVHVNGLVLETAAADIRVDGNSVSESALREGQIIRAVAAVTSTSIDAVTIDYQRNLIGPVGVLGFDGSLIVFRQQVTTDDNTVFGDPNGTSLADIDLSGNIEVSGYRLPSGAIRATYIGAADPAAPLTATATINAVDAAGLTFDVDGVTVDYSQSLVIDLPMGLPDVGLVVEVRGSTTNTDGELVADEIRVLSARPGNVAAVDIVEDAFAPVAAADAATNRANIVGIVTATNLPAAITLNDITISIDALTRFDNGDANDLAPERLVRIEGAVTNAGIIEADVIELL
ncbi:MAG: DUF5666 domain-containing protein [Gammaproteobacteria bacterium]